MAQRKRRRNQDDEPGLIRGAYDAVTGAPAEFAHGILDEADLLLGTSGKKKNRNPRKGKRSKNGGSASGRRQVKTSSSRGTAKARARATKKKGAKSATAKRRATKNPKGQHIPGLAPKYQRMYEDIVETPGNKKRYRARLKEVAARTVRKAAANPSLFSRLFGKKKAKVGHRKTQRGKRKTAAVGYRKTQKGRHHNSGFNEFRGRPGKSTYDAAAADGTPLNTKEAGGLEEIVIGGRLVKGGERPRIVGGKVLRFNRAHHKVLYKGQDLYLGGIKHKTLRNRTVGPMSAITYWADKPHLNSPKHEPYEHFFGEDGGRRPAYCYDHEGMAFIRGGDYRISPDGIIN